MASLIHRLNKSDGMGGWLSLIAVGTLGLLIVTLIIVASSERVEAIVEQHNQS